MSYREENGQVILTMSREDYEFLVLALSVSVASPQRLHDSVDWMHEVTDLLNRLNSGNPSYTPYQVEADEKKS